jgi:hypothetical protein
VRDVVADYSERSLTSALPPIGDPDAVVRDVLDRVAGFGPLQRCGRARLAGCRAKALVSGPRRRGML